MNPRAAGRFLWWVLRAHWLLGILALAVYTETSPGLLAVVAVAWAAGARMDRAGAPRETLSRLDTPLVGLFLAAATADLLLLRKDLLASASLLVVGIQSIKLVLPKRTRDGWQLCAFSLLEFLVGAAVADGLSFAVFFFLFLAASAGAMWALHDREAEELGRPPGGFRPSPRHAAWALLLVGAAGFLSAALLFAVVPRLEFRRGFQRLARGQGVAGFSESITLREVTGIKSDGRIVARVEFPFLGRTPDFGGLYLRGAVYPRYEDGGWRIAKSPVSTVPRSGFHYIVSEAPSGPVSVADILLEPADHPRLFTYGSPVLIEGSFQPLLADAEGNLFLQQPAHGTMQYRLRFAEDPSGRSGRTAGPGDMYLEFPEGYDDVRALGIEAAGSGGTDAERAARILGFFREGFRYTLEDPAPDLRSFLFWKKAGYCEHYATGLALLLRAAEIPSRVAAGYLGGEWNGLGQYVIVRQSDAHAWVEAWIGGRWVTMDATPPQGEASPFFRKTGLLGLSVDWLSQRWDKYVVNYSQRMQAEAFFAGWRGVRRTGAYFGLGRGLPGAPPKSRAAAVAVLIACAALFLLYRWRRDVRRRAGQPEAPRLPAPYERLLRRIERSGFRRSPGVPMEEMVAAAVRSRPELAGEAARFLALYHRDRFGATPLSPAQRSEAYRRADGLKKRLSA
ncbi:MAG: transglutaminaseTgpA domain-containing protein [Thermodesulfobacteriota bacterium]